MAMLNQSINKMQNYGTWTQTHGWMMVVVIKKLTKQKEVS